MGSSASGFVFSFSLPCQEVSCQSSLTLSVVWSYPSCCFNHSSNQWQNQAVNCQTLPPCAGLPTPPDQGAHAGNGVHGHCPRAEGRRGTFLQQPFTKLSVVASKACMMRRFHAWHELCLFDIHWSTRYAGVQIVVEGKKITCLEQVTVFWISRFLTIKKEHTGSWTRTSLQVCAGWREKTARQTKCVN